MNSNTPNSVADTELLSGDAIRGASPFPPQDAGNAQTSDESDMQCEDLSPLSSRLRDHGGSMCPNPKEIFHAGANYFLKFRGSGDCP